jgi:hypothetical protein
MTEGAMRTALAHGRCSGERRVVSGDLHVYRRSHVGDVISTGGKRRQTVFPTTVRPMRRENRLVRFVITATCSVLSVPDCTQPARLFRFERVEGWTARGAGRPRPRFCDVRSRCWDLAPQA